MESLKIKTKVPCPNCGLEIEVVYCEKTTCPWCELKVAVHPHKPGLEVETDAGRKLVHCTGGKLMGRRK